VSVKSEVVSASSLAQLFKVGRLLCCRDYRASRSLVTQVGSRRETM
jgi:hypothetical protein